MFRTSSANRGLVHPTAEIDTPEALLPKEEEEEEADQGGVDITTSVPFQSGREFLVRNDSYDDEAEERCSCDDMIYMTARDELGASYSIKQEQAKNRGTLSSEDDEETDDEEHLMNRLLKDPHSIAGSYERNDEEKEFRCWGVLQWVFGSWLFIYGVDDFKHTNVPRVDDEVSSPEKIKEEVGVSSLFCTKNRQQSEVFTEPRSVQYGDDEECQVKFYSPPKPPILELILLVAYVIIPILVAHQFKFACENDSFAILYIWDYSIRKELKCNKVSKQTKENLKSKTRSIIAMVFWVSGVFAIMVPFNLVRMYTSFILARTSAFQARLNGDLSKFGESMTKARIEAEMSSGKDTLVGSLQKRSSEDDLPQSLIDKVTGTRKKVTSSIEVRKFVAQSKLDKSLSVRLNDAKTMFNDMKVINKKIEGPIQFGLRCLFVVGLAVFVYIFYYSLFFFQDIWPQIQYKITEQPSSMPSISSFPSSLPSTSPSQLPSAVPSITTIPSFQPSSQPSGQPTSLPSQMPSVQPSTLPSWQPSSQPSNMPSFVPSASQRPSTIPTTNTDKTIAPTTHDRTWSPTQTPAPSTLFPTEPEVAPPDPRPTLFPTESRITPFPTEMSPTSFPSEQTLPSYVEKARVILENIRKKLQPHLQNGMLFFLVLLATMLFTILYVWKLLLLFAHQVDAWSKLTAFCEARMSQETNENSYGPQFEQLSVFIKSSSQMFGWMFLLKGQYDSAVMYVTNQAKNRLIGTIASIVIAQIFGFFPNQLGVNDSESNQALLKTLQELVGDSVNSKRDNCLRGSPSPSPPTPDPTRIPRPKPHYHIMNVDTPFPTESIPSPPYPTPFPMPRPTPFPTESIPSPDPTPFPTPEPSPDPTVITVGTTVPVARPDFFTMSIGDGLGYIPVLDNDTPAASQSLVIVYITSQATNGECTIDKDLTSVVYTPIAPGSDSCVYIACDDVPNCDMATVNIQVTT